MSDSNPMAEFVDVIRSKWWQSDTPPLEGHPIGRDLSVVKAWLRQGYHREDLLGALGMYQGPPVTLLVTHKRGQRGLLSELMGKWRSRQEIVRCEISSILREMAKP